MPKKFLTRTALVFSFPTLLFSGAALAHSYRAGAILVDHPWAPATGPGMSMGVAYMKVSNLGPSPALLLGASSPAAARVEIHTMSMDGGVMRMRPATGGVPIAPNAAIVFGPSGLHMMLIGLRQPLEMESMVPMTLTFQGGVTMNIELYIEFSPMGGSHNH